MKIATWNLERPRELTDKRVELIRQQIDQIDADIWILTETNSGLSPGDHFQGKASMLIENVHSSGECRTAIWTRYPILSQIPTYDAKTAVCIEVDSQEGRILVYGTIIPYGGAGTRYGYWFDECRRTGTKSWQLYYESIEIHRSEWARLRAEFPCHLLCIAGDFNQSRDGRRWGKNKRQWYGTNKGRELLYNALDECGVSCMTETDFVEEGQLHSKSSVDHICLDHHLSSSVKANAWEAGIVDGKRLSDHNGVFIEDG